MKTAVIIGVGLAGAFILYELFKPGGSFSSTPSTRTTISSTGNLVSGLVTPVAQLVANLTAPAGPQVYGPAAAGQAATPVINNGVATYPDGTVAPVVPSNFDTSNYTTSDGFMYTDSNGNFVAG